MKLTKKDKRIIMELLGDELYAEDVDGFGAATRRKLIGAGMIQEHRYDSDESTDPPLYSATAVGLEAVGASLHENKNAKTFESALKELFEQAFEVEVPLFTRADLAALFREYEVELDERDQAALERCVCGVEILTDDLAMPLHDLGFRWYADLNRLSSLAEYGLKTAGLNTDCPVILHNHDFRGYLLVCPE